MNIKDSYIHGDLAVVRSIEGLSVSGGNLVLTYHKADSTSTQETKTISISSFNSALSNKFVTLDTAQTVSGKKTFSNGIVVLNGLLFDKGGTAASDDVFHIDGISSYAGKIYLTGSSTSNSANSTTQLVFQSGTTKGAAITSNGNNVIINPSESSTTGLIILLPGTGVTASKFIKSGATASNILLADGSDIAQSTLTNAFTGTVSVTNTSDSPSKLQVTVGSKSGSTVVGYASRAGNADTVDNYHVKMTSLSSNLYYAARNVTCTTNNTWFVKISWSGWTAGRELFIVSEYLNTLGETLIKQLSYNSKFIVTTTDYNGNNVKAIAFGRSNPMTFYLKLDAISNTSSYGGTLNVYIYSDANITLELLSSEPSVTWIDNVAPSQRIYGSNIYANSFIGNASTATALTTNAGSSKIPVYFSEGKPVSTGYDLSTFLTITSASNTYLKLSGGTMTGSIGIKRNSTGGEAIGLDAYGKNSNSISGGIGFLWDDSREDEPYIYLATKTTEPWRSTNGLMITSSNITWKGNKMLTSSDVSGGGNSWGSSLTVNGKTLTIPSNPNTDYQVKQSNKTDNVYYPILLGGNYNATASNIATADKTSQVYQNSGVYVNASTKTIYASTFSGSFSGNSTTSTLTKYTLTSSAYHLVGVNENLTSTATARNAIGRNDVLVTASGAIQAVDTAGFNFGTSATMKYNTTNQSIDFIFN